MEDLETVETTRGPFKVLRTASSVDDVEAGFSTFTPSLPFFPLSKALPRIVVSILNTS